MKPSELPDLHAHLRDALSATSGMSIALSGSLARGDYRTNPEGAITSDLDLIPVVRRATDVASARKQLEPILRETADRFQIVATAAVTLLTAFLDAPHARYVTSMPADPWITDPLDVAAHTPRRFPAPSTAERLPWLLQPVTYYLAKATHDDPATNIGKARAALAPLLEGLTPSIPHALDDLHRTLRTLTAEQRLTPLRSSGAYFAGPTSPNVHRIVRDLVFVENQGLLFAESAMAVTPALPN